jgi:hypothetical protein
MSKKVFEYLCDLLKNNEYLTEIDLSGIFL